MCERRLRAALCALLLSTTQHDAIAQSTGSDGAKQPAIESVDAATIAATHAEVRDVDHWTQLVSAGSGDATDPMAQAFVKWASVLTHLSQAGQMADSDRICAAIVELHAHLPELALKSPSHTPADAFIRDRFRVGDFAVDAAQYFSPERYYKNDPAIVKLYRFSVYKGADVVRRYYLEHSQWDGSDYYVLGRSDPKSGAHYQVQPYGAKQPSYWMLLRRVIQDMNDPAPTYPISSKPRS